MSNPYVQISTGVKPLADVLLIGNTSGGTDLIMSAGDTLTVDTITETGAGTGVTIESILLKDGDAVFLDNDTALFGTGSDSSITYDGTDMVINPKAVGTGDVEIQGNLRLNTDSDQIIFGTGEDANISYDGTDLNYVSNAVGTGVHDFTGDIRLQDSTTALTGGNYAVQIESAKTPTGSVPDTGDANMISMWKFDTGSGTSAVDSKGSHTGTITGATWKGSGQFGYTGDDSLVMDGTEDYVTVPNNAVFDFDNTDTFSIYAWIKTTTAGNNAIVTKMDASSSFRGMQFFINSGDDLELDMISTNPSNLQAVFGASGTTLIDGEWHMVACTYDGSSTAAGIKLYIDGAVLTPTVNNDTLTATTIKAVDMEFGRRGDGALDFTGDMDNVTIYSDVRTPTEILADYNNSQSTAVATIIDTTSDFGATGTLVSFRNNAVEKASIRGDGFYIGGGLNLASSTEVSSILDEDAMGSDSATALATQQSIKAYVDTAVATVDTWAEILALGNTSGATDAIITAGQKITTDTISETTAAAGVTIDSVVLKDGGVNLAASANYQINGTDIIADTAGTATLSNIDALDATTEATIEAAIDTLTLTSLTMTTAITAIIDDDSMGTASATNIATSESIKAYTDTTVGAYLPLAGGTMTGAETIYNGVDAIKSGDYSLQLQSGATGTGTIPSEAGNIVSYWKTDDNGTFPEDTTDANLVLWNKMETGSGTSLVDQQGNYTGTITNATWVGSGDFNASTDSLDFSGSSQYASYGDVTELSNATTFTIEAWVTYDAWNGLAYAKGTDISTDGMYLQVASDGKVYVFLANGGASYGTWVHSGAIVFGTANRYTVVYNGGGGTNADRLKFYLDGVQKTLSYVNTIPATSDISSNSFNIGTNTAASGNYLNGQIDDVAVYSDVRTDDEILRDYNTTRTTITVDSVGTHHGTLVDGAVWNGSGYFGYTGDNSINLPTAGDYITVADSTDFTFGGGADTAFSIYAWVKADSYPGQAGIVSKWDSVAGAREWALWLDSNDELNFAIYDEDNNAIKYRRYSVALTDTTNWQFLAATYDGSTNVTGLKIYINGVQVDDETVTDSGSYVAMRDTAEPVNIGFFTTAGLDDWIGDMDNVIIYNDERSSAEILADYNAGIASGDAWVFNTTSTLGATGNVAIFQNNGTAQAQIGTDGTLEIDTINEITAAAGVTIDGLKIENDGTTTNLLGTVGDYIQIGDAAGTSHTLNSEDDLMVTGELEVDGTAFFDGSVQLGASVDFAYVAKTATYTIDATDHTIDCTANTFTVTLPTAASIAGRIYNIKNSGTGIITVDGNGSETIDGSTTIELLLKDCVTVQSNGTNWIII